MNAFVDGWLFVFKEAFEGGAPGQPTAFLDGTDAGGGNNHGVLATLTAISAAQASEKTALGLSICSHASHVAFHLEVGRRWAAGERGPFDWAGSFSPDAVDEAAWQEVQTRIRRAYEGTLEWVAKVANADTWDEDAAGGLSAGLAHAAYHLGAIRQVLKLLEPVKR